MNTDTHQQYDELTRRLDDADRSRRRSYAVWGSVAVAAVLVVVAAVVATLPRASDNSIATPTPTATPVFTSSAFGVPFALGSLPGWARDETRSTGSGDERSAVWWERCPAGGKEDARNECVGLEFDRYEAVPGPTADVAVTYASYLAYIDGLVTSGALTVTDRTSTTVGGRPAVVFTARSTRDIGGGLGCEALGGDCRSFYAWDSGRYAVVDTGTLDPDGKVLVIWTRGHGLGAAESGWLEQFDAMLATMRFMGSATPRASG